MCVPDGWVEGRLGAGEVSAGGGWRWWCREICTNYPIHSGQKMLNVFYLQIRNAIEFGGGGSYGEWGPPNGKGGLEDPSRGLRLNDFGSSQLILAKTLFLS